MPSDGKLRLYFASWTQKIMTLASIQIHRRERLGLVTDGKTFIRISARQDRLPVIHFRVERYCMTKLPLQRDVRSIKRYTVGCG